MREQGEFIVEGHIAESYTGGHMETSDSIGAPLSLHMMKYGERPASNQIWRENKLYRFCG